MDKKKTATFRPASCAACFRWREKRAFAFLIRVPRRFIARLHQATKKDFDHALAILREVTTETDLRAWFERADIDEAIAVIRSVQTSDGS